MNNNPDIQNLAKVLGLSFGSDYSNTKSLRYDSIMLVADSDNDGIHFKGLILNFIHVFWPSLLKLNTFIKEFRYPSVSVNFGQENAIEFFEESEYESWKRQQDEKDLENLTVHYYSGLASISSKQARVYFENLSQYTRTFIYEDAQDDEVFELAFSRKQCDARKHWISNSDLIQKGDQTSDTVKYADFINYELRLFHLADCQRAIPSVIDGLKTSERKVLFSAFDSNLAYPIQISELSAFVQIKSAFKHGEYALNNQIILMNQSFTGSNNINLLVSEGQVGSRYLGGRDSGSPRYIPTKLSPISRLLFL